MTILDNVIGWRMDHEFWHRKWHDNALGFHAATVNPLLEKYYAQCFPASGSRIFLPLCGKTLDIHWLLAQGQRVVGVELSPLAVSQLFDELGMQPQVTPEGALDRYAAEGIEVFVGDFFALDAATLGTVSFIYDRAALVALPDGLRSRYAHHLMALTHSAPQLLVTYVYEQHLQAGPPFAVQAAEARHLYAEHYRLELLETLTVPDGLKGQCPAQEQVWSLLDKEGL